jgi:preprotein translocase subunit YajC
VDTALQTGRIHIELAHRSLYRSATQAGRVAMKLKTGDLVRTKNGKVGSVVLIDADRTVVVMLDDHGARFRLHELQLINSDANATAGAR